MKMAKVLLVEDDINLREIYAARLIAEGYDVVVASDGEEALAKAVKEKPQLILLDIMMPKISGFDVLDILRSTPETKTTKVIMLTALSQSIDRERGKKLGVNKYLVKSQITLEDVVKCVQEMISGTEPKPDADPKVEATKEAAAIDGALRNLETNIPVKPVQSADTSTSGSLGGVNKPTPGSTNPNNGEA